MSSCLSLKLIYKQSAKLLLKIHLQNVKIKGMKPRFIFYTFVFLLTPMLASAEVIQNYDVHLEIREDGILNVKETILYDFEGENKHGIYRTIPTEYEIDGKKGSFRIQDISVRDEMGSAYKIKVSGNNVVNIRIGDPNLLVTGRKTYVIEYTVRYPVIYGYAYERDVLYWDAVGHEWDVPIGDVDVTVVLPPKDAETLAAVSSGCYFGPYGSGQTCPQDYDLDISTHSFSYNVALLSAREGMTVAIGFPKGYIAEPSVFQKFIGYIYNNFAVIFAALIPIGALVFVLFDWIRRGRDARGRGTIVAQYDPPDGLSPIEAGTIKDERIDAKDLVAEIIYLAERGYIKIKKNEKKVLGIFSSADYELKRMRPEKEDLKPFQNMLISFLFTKGETVALSSLKDKFQARRKALYEEVYKRLTTEGYFVQNPQKASKIYTYVLIPLLLVVIYFVDFMEVYMIISIILTMAVFLIGSKIIPAKTAKGVAVKEYMQGLRDYIEKAEQARIQFHNAPEKNPEHFEKLLPYAILFGLEKEWAKEFRDIHMENPKWYSSAAGSYYFSANEFAGNMSGFASAFNSSAGASSSGGGGFSGGGGGGGGGGSW